GTVAREKDRRTFILLLLTDMTDAEIVLGKLLGSLLPIGLMLVGTLPVLALLLLLGGVTPHQVLNAWLILVATAVAAGSRGGPATGVVGVYGYVIAMIVASVLLNAWGVYKLRDWNPGGEPVMQRETPEEEEAKDRAKAHAAPGTIRRVWRNPVLWREVCTRA